MQIPTNWETRYCIKFPASSQCAEFFIQLYAGSDTLYSGIHRLGLTALQKLWITTPCHA
jgi:hypothetical protein